MTTKQVQDKELLGWARGTLEIEAQALKSAGARLGDAFVAATRAMLERKGKVVVTGLGKSGHVARKIAATLSSTGTSAFFLHPSEAMHGDFGMLQSTDCLMAVAYGGETHEVNEVARFARRIGIPIIGITGNSQSTLAQLSHYVIDGWVEREADALNLAPTCSSTVAMALGDAFAVALMRARGFTEGDFASLHPGGSLGRRLSLVQDHMQPADRLAKVREDADFHAVLQAVTANNFGITAVVDGGGRLLGAISDGDLRRALLKSGADALTQRAGDLMSHKPKVILASALALDAVTVMNEHRISSLFVVDQASDRVASGIIRLQDLLAAKIL